MARARQAGHAGPASRCYDGLDRIRSTLDRISATVPDPQSTPDRTSATVLYPTIDAQSHFRHHYPSLPADPTRGASIALLAPRRCGKTSVHKMLPALLPDAVRIFFDLQEHPVDTPEDGAGRH